MKNKEITEEIEYWIRSNKISEGFYGISVTDAYNGQSTYRNMMNELTNNKYIIFGGNEVENIRFALYKALNNLIYLVFIKKDDNIQLCLLLENEFWFNKYIN